jgi:hypothetical protein
MKLKYTGINIQYPISELILNGKKTIETRTYPIPKKYMGKDMLLVETPGKNGKFKARVIAIIKFDDCFLYSSSYLFYKDKSKHHVDPSSKWAWTDSKPKWGWLISYCKPLKTEVPLKRQPGIKFTCNLSLPNK